MTYIQRRDAYHEHMLHCKECVSTHSGKRYFMDERGMYKSRYATVSLFCKTARALLDAII